MSKLGVVVLVVLTLGTVSANASAPLSVQPPAKTLRPGVVSGVDASRVRATDLSRGHFESRGAAPALTILQGNRVSVPHPKGAIEVQLGYAHGYAGEGRPLVGTASRGGTTVEVSIAGHP